MSKQSDFSSKKTSQSTLPSAKAAGSESECQAIDKNKDKDKKKGKDYKGKENTAETELKQLETQSGIQAIQRQTDNEKDKEQEKEEKQKLSEIKAVVCDLDGTLLNNKSDITDYTRDIIQQIREKGIKFGICTGRPVSGLPKLLKKWKLEDLVDFVIGFNGGSLIDLKSPNHDNNKHIEQDCSLSKEQIMEVFALFDRFHPNYCAYHGDEIWTEKYALAPYFMSRRNGLKYKKKSKEDLIRESQKIMITASPKKISRILKEARKDPKSKNFNFFRSGPFLIEILHPKLSKAKGIEKIARLYHIKDKEILAFGNDNNDLEMLEKATGVAMKNGLSSLKEKADFISEESNDKDGVARFLKAHLLEK